jgi:hypothetical protein
MATITLKINERSGIGKAILDLITNHAKEGKSVEIIETPNLATINAMLEAKQGKTKKFKNVEDLFKELKS